MDPDILTGYADAADELVARYEAVSPAILYAPVAAHLPPPPASVIDIGAGTGRDAAWFARRGHRPVVAVEPVAALRDAGRSLHASDPIDWHDDRLPDLPLVSTLGRRFDLVLLSGVWQHLQDDLRPEALRALAGLCAPGGRIVLSLRHGPGAPTRPVFPASADDAVGWAIAAGLSSVARIEHRAIQAGNRAAGVRWTWLTFASPSW